eukprot:CAMPEP_0170487340 /NCGR_PEP_ID=MMETSP0208-20121228/6190_1 /TAXON_ID=197538 /ORGANISM="Strombidium inclinatum, Strain S3" /LENGTH=156 /DNA_ID=CAMNT_0010761601 /DNA_START=927 /DNA_END=1397 /DNA_ORIENTATION=-
MRKFFVDDGYSGLLGDQKLFIRFNQALQTAFQSLEDIKEGEEVDVMIKFKADGPVFNILKARRAGNILSKIYFKKGQDKVIGSHPNLVKHMMKRMKGKLNEEGLMEKEERYPLGAFLNDLTVEDLKEIVDQGIQMYYSGEGYPKQEEEDTLRTSFN